MLDEEARARRAASRTAFFLALGLVLACIGAGCFTIGSVEMTMIQAERQKKTDLTAHSAAIKSAKVLTRTTALKKEQELIREKSIKNCQTLSDYVHKAIGTRQESEANAYGYAAVDQKLADLFAQFRDPLHLDIAAVYRARIKLDHQRAHVARESQNELIPALKETCTLPLPVGT